MLPEPLPDSDVLRQALADLRSLAHTDRGVLEVTACGPAAIPALRQILFEREPSGLAQIRCAAAEALAALGAHAVLIDFLAAPHAIADPVERVGTETAMDCATRVLLHCDDPRLPALVLGLAETRLLPGAIDWLGARHCVKALPYLAAALGDDIARPAAEAALLGLGTAAAPTLWQTALKRASARGVEDETSRRRCLAALSVLLRLGPDAGAIRPSTLAELCADQDPVIAAAACRLLLGNRTLPERRAAVRRLIALLDQVDFVTRSDIEDALVAQPDLAREALAEAARSSPEAASPAQSIRARALSRIATRLRPAPPSVGSATGVGSVTCRAGEY